MANAPAIPPGANPFSYTPLMALCEPIEYPAAPVQIDIPHFGILQKAWDGLHSIPKPSDMLAKFQDTLATAMAPIRRYLEMVEVMMAFKQCMSSVVDAIEQLSPQPIFDCLKSLLKVIPRILAWFPPMCYVKLALDLANYCMLLINEILQFFQEIDDLITDYVNAYMHAALFLDSDLQAILSCGLSNIKLRLNVVLDMLKFVQPVMNVLMVMFIRMLVGDTVKQLSYAMEEYGAAAVYMASFSKALASGSSLPGANIKNQHQIVPIPPIGTLIQQIGRMYNALVVVYNALAPLVGMDANKRTLELPSFVNF